MAETKLKNQAFTSVDLDAWNSFTPAYANLTEGSATNTGYYCQIGKTVHFRTRLVFAADTSISGSVTLTLPVTAATYGNASVIGHVLIQDTGTALYFGMIWSTGAIYLINANSTYIGYTALSSSVPMSWANTDEMMITGTYEAA